MPIPFLAVAIGAAVVPELPAPIFLMPELPEPI